MNNVLIFREDRDQLSSLVFSSSSWSTAPVLLTFLPLAVQPEQFFSLPCSHDKGETALMYAVLEDAFYCFAGQFVDEGVRAQRLAAEAEAWFFCDDVHWPFSFVNICLALRLEPGYMRLGLQQWRQHRPAQIKWRKRRQVRRTRLSEGQRKQPLAVVR